MNNIVCTNKISSVELNLMIKEKFAKTRTQDEQFVLIKKSGLDQVLLQNRLEGLAVCLSIRVHFTCRTNFLDFLVFDQRNPKQVFQLKYFCPKLKFLDSLILEITKNKNFEFSFFVFDSSSYLNQCSHRFLEVKF